MSQDGFTSAEVPYTGLAITAAINGLGRNSNTFNSWAALDANGTVSTEVEGTAAARTLWGIPKSQLDAVYDGEGAYIADFGLMRELALSIAPSTTRDTLNEISYVDDSIDYPLGPYAHAASRLDNLVGMQRSFIITMWEGTVALPAMSAAPDPSTAVNLLTANSTVWGTGVVDSLANMLGLPSSYYNTILGYAASGYTFPTAATLPAISVPTLTWVAPTGGAISAATITAPTAVDVSDDVDAAVASFTALANTRLTADQAQLRATLFSTRQAMTSTFDGALAILAANASAQIADYDKSARLDQARTQAQADMEHQRLSVQVGSQNAQLGLDAAKANSQFALSSKDTETRFLLGAASAVTAAQSAANEVALSTMRARGELLRMIYDTTIAWMGAKASLLTNAGPVASVINNAYDLQYKTALAAREQFMGWQDHISKLTTQQTAHESGLAAIKYNALTQNLQLYRDVINTAGGIGGSTHKPSTFENVSSAVGMGAGLISTGVQIALAVAG
jgi:hypothetical protein